VFRPEARIREARRQKGWAAVGVPEICILDPDGGCGTKEDQRPREVALVPISEVRLLAFQKAFDIDHAYRDKQYAVIARHVQLEFDDHRAAR
jgi:hypothetical protein